MTESTPARPKGRSPSYPAITLSKAIERAESLWAKERQFPAAVEAVVRHWGYAGMTGPAGLTIAALKKYGLVDDEGAKSDRKVRLTDLGIQILNHPDAEVRAAGVREAALTPPVHREMWDRYGADLPSDENLMWTLTREDAFTESGAQEFIRQYRETIRFARLSESENDPGADSESPAGESPTGDARPVLHLPSASAKQGSTPPNSRSVDILLPNGEGSVSLVGPFPINEDHWDYVLNVLAVMKPGFVRKVSNSSDRGEASENSNSDEAL